MNSVFPRFILLFFFLFFLWEVPHFGQAPDPKKSPPSKNQKEVGGFFASPKVLDIVIEIGPKEMDALRREPRKYVKATLKEGGKEFKNIGIHVKGAAGSFRGIDDKPGLTLNMDKYDEVPAFYGMDKWHLSNSVQDPSYISELICGELFRAAGIPASRVSHAVVTINGRKKGLYYLKEGYDGNFLNHHFGTKNGNLYDGGFLRELDQPLQLLSSKNDVANHADLKALMNAAREANPKLRMEKIGKVLDLDQFLSYTALQVITWDWDGYPMNRNNYRIYHDTKRDKLIFIPSGMDQMFGDPNGTLFPNFQGFIARAIIETPEGKERYINRVTEVMEKVYKKDQLLKRLDELQKVIQPALAAVDKGAGNDYPNQVNRLRNAIQQREKNVQDQLKNLKKK